MELLNGDSPLNRFKSKNFGEFKIVEYKDCNHIKIEFLNTGYSYVVQQIQILTGNVKDRLMPTCENIGYIGDGEYNSSHKSYKHWRHMFKRCYGKSAPKNPAVVCNEWHNFQNFAKWFDLTFPFDSKEIMCLDKDKRYNGEKVYSPETCSWLEFSENASLQGVENSVKVMSPNGNIFNVTNQTAFAKEHNLRPNSLNNIIKGVWAQYKGWKVIN